ncbi:MAG TPA: CPBP family intramembrane glutamic endopeptidase [Dermatophilaceae bacterium]|nr:CPBP family intramembrane glutamic endopeptidase [Dermatophilaceae bacterium]
MSTTTTPQQPSVWRGVITRYPVAAFLFIALPAAMAAMSVPVMAAYDVIPGKHIPERVGFDLEETASLFLVMILFCTVLTVTRIVDGREGVRILLRRMTRWQVPLRWWLLAVAAMPVGTILLAVVLGDEVHPPTLNTLSAELAALLLAFALANLGEEGTWSGFMQTRLERRHNFLLAAFMTAVPFAIVHLPLRVITKEATTATELLGSFILLVGFCLFFRTFIGTVARGAANSVLLAAVAHTFFNRSNNADGLAADVLTGPNQQSAATLTAVFLTVTLAALNRRRLTKTYRHELDAAEEAALVERCSAASARPDVAQPQR